jgi:biotin-dependent carboxylase-like uncharacterized protein
VALLVINPGLRTTVQDGGRQDHRAFGVPVGGAFDRRALTLANALLGNSSTTAALEMTHFGGTYRSEANLAIALAGAPMTTTLETPDGRQLGLTIPQSLTLPAGSTLTIGGTTRGARTYLAVLGGWRTPVILGSRSSETILRTGDLLSAEPSRTPVRRPAMIDLESGPIRIIDGPDAALLEPANWDDLEYRVGRHCDRVGIRLEGPELRVHADPERTSAPVAPGALQVAGTRPIILGVACGTMGGYPHVAHVLAIDLDRLGQVRPGEQLRFQRIKLDDARRLDREERRRRAAAYLQTATLATDEIRCCQSQ